MKELIKVLLRENLLNEQSDCSNLFTNSADGSYHLAASNNDLYYYVVKLISVKRVLMSPTEFFDVLGGLEKHKMIDPVYVNKKIESFKNGEKLPMPYLTYNEYGKNISHEGRHRTVATMKFGCKLIPVMVEKTHSTDKVMELANKLGDLEPEIMEAELSNLGFKHFQNFDRVATILRLSKQNGEYYEL